MNRKNSPVPPRSAILIEALEPRIAPAGLLNESKFTSVAVGGTLLLDASGAPGTFQGLTTGSGGGSGSYLLYITSGRALVYTTDLNGNGKLDPGEITGIALGKDSLGHDPALILFSDVNGDIVTNLQGTSGSLLTDSDHNPNNGRDGQLLNDTNIASITLRTVTSSDLDPTITGDTVNNRLALTSFSIHGDVIAGGGIGGITIDTSGTGALAAKFDGSVGDQLYTSSIPTINGLYTGSAANYLSYHFTQNNPSTPQVEGVIQPFHAPALEHGGDISNVAAASAATTFSIGTIAAGDGGAGARGGNISGVTLHGAIGGYQLLAGDGGDGNVGGAGGSIIGFSDLGSFTGEAIIHSGNGGVGLLGVGGVGGQVTFGATSVAAGVHVILGNGGNGFGNGGNGASLPTATFTTPETNTPVGGKFLGTWHNLGDVGNTHPNADGTYSPEVLDFNGDGFGDGVFTSTVPDQVTVVFGDGFGGLLDNNGDFNGTTSATINLKVPGMANPVVTIGDFNGDGRPDIAVASGSGSNFAGIYVFLDQIGTALDPINSHNFTHSLVGDHPFSAPLATALPTFVDALGAYQTSGGIVALAAGDYNGDGITDIAYVQNLTAEVTKTPFQTIGVLLGDAAPRPNSATQALDTTTGQIYDTGTNKLAGSGYFYANAATTKAAPILLNSTALPGTDILHATSLSNTNLPDATTRALNAPEVFVFGQQGAQGLTAFSLAIPDTTTHLPTALTGAGIGLGLVDTNRARQTPQANNISLVQATLQDFSLQDVDQDGSVDLIALTKAPTEFLVEFQGTGNGGFNVASNPFGSTSNDNSGIYLGDNRTGIAITAVDANTDPAHVGTFDSVGILFLPTGNPGPFISEARLQNPDGTPSFYPDFVRGTATFGRNFGLGIPVQDQTVLALDTYYQVAPTADNLHPGAGYGVLAPESSSYIYADLFIFGADTNADGGNLTFSRYLTENGYAITSGNGGSSTTGNGGNGGVIGSATVGVGGGAGAVSVTFPVAASYLGQAFFKGGDGGVGSVAGGNGGDISSVTVRYAAGAGSLDSDVEIAAGNGGNGNSGNGGNGGSLSLLSVESGTFFSAGNAGSGLHGGNGGSISGNQSGVYDTFSGGVELHTGNGGQGAIGGGTGGTISGWDTEIYNFIGSSGSYLIYTTGAGGSAAGGAGGNGGAITNSSPSSTQNNLSGQLSLQTGAGGSGLTGGSGGAITNFNNNPTSQSALATALSVITGNGGSGVNGAGGTGGSITNFSSNATGLTNPTGSALTGIGRIIAGDGGESFAGAGGVGGTISTVTATTTSTPLVVAAGAGGTGITAGGDGGSVINSTINSAAVQVGKMLVVGGVGGDALAAQPQDIFLPNDADTTDLAHAVLAFGNTLGQGGNGGNITNITQPVGAQTAVDLIAGNGGSTPNASTPITAVTGVGHGGSVTGVTLTGTVGAISRDTTLGAVTNPPIKAYSFTDATGATNTSISAFVDFIAAAGNPNDPQNFASMNFVLDDTVGNVGIVAGAAGTVRGAQPAPDGVNGDVTGITAQSIMSIVAGSVNSVAPVRNLSGITLTSSDGVLGADKSPNSPYGPNGQLDYFNPTLGLDVNSLASGDALIDGAIYASTITQSTGTLIRGPRVFPVSS